MSSKSQLSRHIVARENGRRRGRGVTTGIAVVALTGTLAVTGWIEIGATMTAAQSATTPTGTTGTATTGTSTTGTGTSTTGTGTTGTGTTGTGTTGSGVSPAAGPAQAASSGS